MLDFDLNRYCYGCGVCGVVCPQNAIRMEDNAEGFAMPVVDRDRCIKCSLCEKACPRLSPLPSDCSLSQSHCFAAYLKEEELRSQSTSGAVFPALAEKVLEEGGFVCGCVWNDKLEAVHILSDKRSDVKRMLGSKYVQSSLGDSFLQIKKVLDSEKKVLFSGTPCQVAALLSYMGRRKNLFTCAVICAGVPSPKVWHEHVACLEKRYQSEMDDVNFRFKGKYGWQTSMIRYKFKNGKTKIMPGQMFDEYLAGFGANLYLRNSCSSCQFRGDGYAADIIIGDFWGAPKTLFEKSRNKGISAVLVQTEQGGRLLSQCGDAVELQPVSFAELAKKNPPLVRSTPASEKRKLFFSRLDELPLRANIRGLIGNRFLKKMCYLILFHTGSLNWIKRKIKRVSTH